MPAHWIEPDATLGAQRDEVVVCIPVYGAHEHFVGCLRSVLAHTPPDVRVLICDDASPDRRSEEFVHQLEQAGSLEHPVFYVRRDRNVGFPANVNGAFVAAAPADVVVLNSDCVVAAGWIEGLRDAAYTDSTVATATALTNHGTVVSVPDRIPVGMLPQEWSFDEAAAAVREHSLRLHPRLLTAIGHCFYVRRSALELVGDFDLAFSPGYGEEVDFSQRCLRTGLSHVAADDVLVLHHSGASLGVDGRRNPVQDEHEQVLAERYPYYHDWIREVENDVTGPLARSLNVARRVLKGLSLVIDGRILVDPMTGTQLHVLELVAALARTERARIHVLVSSHLSPTAGSVLEQLAVELVEIPGNARKVRIPRADVVHRPFQVSGAYDLALLASAGERLVVTHQDMIGYRNPSYFESFERWQEYRKLTQRALAVADRTIFFSAHARSDAIAEDLVEPHRADVVHIGVDHSLSRVEHEPAPPRQLSGLPESAEVILCLGTDFRHKNRLFALRLIEQLQRRHDWDGTLVLAGPRVARGSSNPEEDELLALDTRLARAVLDVAAISEGEKLWLMRRTRLVLYPTVYEGFGLVPFEAAHHGVPCMWARGTSLSELLPDDAAGIVPWDPVISADNAHRLLRDDALREQNVAAVRAAAAELTWEKTAAGLLGVYNAACDGPQTAAGALERSVGMMGGGVSEDALRLVGPDGILPTEVERPLLALSSHRAIGDPVFRVMKAGYRASRWRRRRRENGERDER